MPVILAGIPSNPFELMIVYRNLHKSRLPARRHLPLGQLVLTNRSDRHKWQLAESIAYLSRERLWMVQDCLE